MGNNLTGKLGSAKINIVENVIPDWNQNDPTAKDYVKNRPGGYDIPPTVDISWDGDMTGKETMDGGASGLYFVKIADEAPPIESFAVTNAARAARSSKPEYAATIAVRIVYNDGTSDDYSEDVNVKIDESGEYYIANSEDMAIFGVLADSVEFNGTTVTKGLWASLYEEADK